MMVTLQTRFKSFPAAVPFAALVVAMISIQIGAALAKRLFPLVGTSGTTALRLGFAALLLLAVWRPWRMRPTARDLRSIVIYGLAMGWMNLLFYASLDRIPLGIAVALEFTGPLAVAVAASRRPVDFLWILLAVLGLIALLPLAPQSKPLAPLGMLFALAAGACWAIYILFGQRTGAVHGGQTAALGTLVAALVIVPIGAIHAGSALLAPAILPVAFGVALLSSAVPYSLEMFALTRLPTQTFGVLMSMEPVLGALSGLWFLGEHLTVVQWAAVVSLMGASAGSAATARSGSAASKPKILQ